MKTPSARASMGAAHPLGRPIEPEDCANGALFLASDLVLQYHRRKHAHRWRLVGRYPDTKGLNRGR